ncbi:ElyC/SanA/YdcF family protein [Calothrix sp. NIES-2098]|uniref:ElyC/SanA/YdcF family protein n=1 Tax=Calothrix sp. NIES-2098 TaxID=1954171 RepID=UPI000BBC6DA2
MNRWHRKIKKYGIFTLASIILMWLSVIPIRIAIASYQAPYPQAIFTLGGGPDREEFTAQFAQIHPTLDIWVSSGSPPDTARTIFHNAGIPNSRLHLDYRAVDTVTNFTSLVADFKQSHIQHVYLVTSDFHLPRAKFIAILVLGSQGIIFTSVSIPSNRPRESMAHILRDIGRSLFWIISGRSGASLNPNLK